MVVAADILTNSYNALRSLATSIGADVELVDEKNAVIAIGACWAIVDQLHAMRQLLKAISDRNKPYGPKTKALMEATETATLMRNKMDHVAENLNNLGSRVGSVAPLMGSVSYFCGPQESLHSGASMTLFSASLTGEQIAQIVNPLGRTFAMPVGLFEFFAYDLHLDIEPALNAVREYFEAAGPGIEVDFQLAAAEHSKELGLDAADLLISARGTFGIAAFFGSDPKE